jgi:GntR family transcriptional regulator/MocR family aminotransferase
MARLRDRRAGRAIPLVHLRSSSAIPLYQQLYLSLRQSILGGQLAGGTRLASTRTLAVEWGVSRFTVVNAMERLLAEGYLTARQGAGTFVVDTLPETTMVAARAPAPAPTKRADRGAAAHLSSRGLALSAVVITGPRTRGNEPRPFHPRRAPLDVFPLELWRRIVRRQWAATDYHRLDYADPAGHPALREAIAAHISVTRAVRCTPQQVVITSGSQQAFDILFRLLLDPGEAAWIEEPGYLDVRAALVGAGAKLIAVPVDSSGIDVAEGVRLAPRASLAVVSPSHQYPTGVTLSATRRAALLDWARGGGAWIVEDDYDSYFRYSGRPMSSLQGVDRDASVSHSPCVVYVGTFSKTVFPGLRLGFCVVPDSILDAVTNARAVADRNSPLVDQAALAEFIGNGHYDQHLRRIRVACQERYEALQSHCAKHIPELSLSVATAGTHVIGRLRDGSGARRSTRFATALSRAAAEDELVVFPLSRYCLRRSADDAIVLGFGGVSPRRIAIGVERLARTFARVRRQSE